MRPFHAASRRLGLIGLILFLVIGFSARQPLLAQSTIPTAWERLTPPSQQQRAELFRQLQQQTAVLEAQSTVVKTVAKLLGPTVVHVRADVGARYALQHGGGRQVEEEGSGVIIKHGDRLHVLTNHHVVAGAEPRSIHLRLFDGRTIHPVKVRSDPETDVAALSLSELNLPFAPLGNSDRLEIGDFVLAVGSPYGLSHSVTFGIVSAKGRRDLELGDAGVKLQDFLQTDAAINPGNSGGPLINLRGEVVGINTCIASHSGGNEGIAFAIPINIVASIARQLIDTGKVSRAYLGVTLDVDFGPAGAARVGLKRPMGTRVTYVTAGSPAAEADVRVGDVVLMFDGRLVEDDNHLVSLVSLTEVGKSITVVVYRDRRPVELRARVGPRSGS